MFQTGGTGGAKSLGEDSRAQKVGVVRGGGQEMTSEAGLRQSLQTSDPPPGEPAAPAGACRWWLTSLLDGPLPLAPLLLTLTGWWQTSRTSSLFSGWVGAPWGPCLATEGFVKTVSECSMASQADHSGP